jgi:hypothetical protein
LEIGEKMTKDVTLDPQPVLGALHYALMCLEKGDTAGAKHGIHEALFRMGFTEDNLRITPKERKELERQKARLYAKLAKDTEMVAARQKHYAAIAYDERKISDVDAVKAKSEGEIARVMDDKSESDICREFRAYRTSISNLFEDRAEKYRKLEEMHLEKAKTMRA